MIGEVSAVAYLDTGSRVNIITTRKYLDLKIPIASSSVIMTGFGGKKTLSRGRVSLKVHIDDLYFDSYAEVADVDLQKLDLIVGRAIINQPGISLLTTENSATLLRTNELLDPFSNLALHEPLTKVPIYSEKSSKIAPGTNATIPILIKDKIAKENVLVTSAVLVAQGPLSYYIPPTVISPADPFITVMNIGTKELE